MQTLEFHAKEEGGGVEEREAEKCGFGAGTICGRVKKKTNLEVISPHLRVVAAFYLVYLGATTIKAYQGGRVAWNHPADWTGPSCTPHP